MAPPCHILRSDAQHICLSAWIRYGFTGHSRQQTSGICRTHQPEDHPLHPTPPAIGTLRHPSRRLRLDKDIHSRTTFRPFPHFPTSIPFLFFLHRLRNVCPIMPYGQHQHKRRPTSAMGRPMHLLPCLLPQLPAPRHQLRAFHKGKRTSEGATNG